MQNIITQLETSHLESKQNSYKQLNPKFEPMLKVKVFPFYMQVLQKILKKKERKKERW
jgi:ribonuclease HIII